MSRRRSLFWHLWGLYLLIVIATLGLLGILLSHLLQHYFYAAKQRELLHQGQELATLAGPLFTGEHRQADTQQLLNVSSAFLTGRAAVVDYDGLVVATVGPHPWGKTQGGVPCCVTQQMPELLTVMQGQMVTGSGYSPLFDEPVLLAAVPIRVQGKVTGAVITHARVAGLRETVGQIRFMVFGAALAAIALSTLLGFFLARSIARPLQSMNQLAGQMASGFFSSRITDHPVQEIHQLSHALNHLSASLQETMQSLSEEQEKLGQIVASMGEAVIAVNRDGQVLMVNPQVPRILGIGQTVLAGETIDVEPLSETFIRAIQNGKDETIEWERKDGGVLRAHISPTSLPDSLVGAVAVVQDVTHLHTIERMRRQFVADASHQLRSPLTTMQGYAEALLDGIVLDEETRQRYLAMMVRDARRLSQLIAQLLDLSHLESGQAKIESRVCSLSDVISRTVEAIPESSDQPRVTVDLPADLPPACANELYTEQALRNLLDNAIRHTPSEGQVTVWARPEANHLVIGVTDTGNGITSEHLAHIWDRFYRVDDDRTEGSGLGLAIVKSLVERQGGHVTAKSEPGQGSVFTFTLPRAMQA